MTYKQTYTHTHTHARTRVHLNIYRFAASAIYSVYHQTNAQSLLGWFPWTGNSRQSVVAALRTSVDTSTKQYRDFNKNVIDVRSHSIRDAIKRNYLSLFKHPRYKTTFKQGKNIETLPKNVALCGQLSVQNRYGDLAEFLAHEIQSVPQSLSNLGKFNLPSAKSDLLRCLKLHGKPDPHLTHDCKVMDGAVIVHCLLTSVSTSHAYADAIFIPYLENQLQSVTSLDVAWDIDIPDSLTKSTQAERQGCSQESVWPNCQTIGWTSFVTQWKRRNFVILIPKVAQFSWPRAVYVTSAIGKLWFRLVRTSPVCCCDVAVDRQPVGILSQHLLRRPCMLPPQSTDEMYHRHCFEVLYRPTSLSALQSVDFTGEFAKRGVHRGFTKRGFTEAFTKRGFTWTMWHPGYGPGIVVLTFIMRIPLLFSNYCECIRTKAPKCMRRAYAYVCTRDKSLRNRPEHAITALEVWSARD